MDAPKVFRDRLRRLRLELGLTQEELSKEIGIPKSTYQGLETGRSEANFEMLVRLANYFDVSIDYLLGRTTERRPVQKQVWLLSRNIAELSVEDRDALFAVIDAYIHAKKHGYTGPWGQVDPRLANWKPRRQKKNPET